MSHKLIRGKISYIHKYKGETGREWFSVTVLPDGTKTICAHCEMDEDFLLRDVIWTNGPDGRPLDAYVRLSLKGKFFGSGFFEFKPNFASSVCMDSNGIILRQTLPLDEAIDIFGAHPVSGDAMKTSLFKFSGKNRQFFSAISTSDLPNGASGPTMCRRELEFEWLGEEEISVNAGTFLCRHFRWHFKEFPPIDIWNTGIHHLPVRIKWELLSSRYDLVEINYLN